MHNMSIENQLDDSEYIRNAKTIIDATERYLDDNPEVVQDPQLLKQVLYVHSRNLWLMNQSPGTAKMPETIDIDNDSQEYQTYYFDYVYNHSVYPR
jgi:hypothetical protein